MIKRLFDLLFSMIGIVLLSPVLIFVALIIKISSKGPVFFRQVRVGRCEKFFRIFKFRTMYVDSKGLEITVGGRDPRVTKNGFFLRKYKLDEFPQLFNVVKGEMSLVGPRPEVPKYVALYDDEQRQVLSVRPGITDSASIEYRNENELLKNCDDPEKIYIEEIMPAKLLINLEYLHRRSLVKDIALIVKTMAKVLF